MPAKAGIQYKIFYSGFPLPAFARTSFAGMTFYDAYNHFNTKIAESEFTR